MLRRALLVAAAVMALGASAQVASADPTNAPNSLVVTATCNGTDVSVVVNGNGTFSPGLVIGSTAVFVPTAFDLTFSFTPTGGTTETNHETAAKPNAPEPTVTCDIPEALNTFTSPEGTFTISGTVTGFFTPPL
jgi:opacity protein-like surface antigen